MNKKEEIDLLLKKLLYGMERIKKWINALDKEDFSTKTGDGGMSFKEMICQLCDHEISFSYQAKKIISEDNPSIIGFDSGRWAVRLDYGSQDPLLAFQIYKYLRIQILKILMKRPFDDFERKGIHAEKGFLSLVDLIEEAISKEDELMKILQKALKNIS